jgi:hypothetical protein
VHRQSGPPNASAESAASALTPSPDSGRDPGAS